MKTIIKILLLVLLVSCQVSLAGTKDPNIDDSEYIEYGKKFESVLEFVGSDSSNQLFQCSSVAIHPDWILTSAHAVETAKNCIVKYNGRNYPIDKVIIHDGFKKEEFGKNDIALCRLKESLPIKTFPALYDNSDELDKICSISGYGLYGSFLTGVVGYDGKKRAGTNVIEKISNHLLVCSPSIVKNKTKLEFIGATGDSGGGLFIGEKLAGVTSCVFHGPDKKGNSNYGDSSGHTRVSLFIHWIGANISKHSKQKETKFSLEKLF